MSTKEYRRGFEDGLAVATAKSAIGTVDRTKYEFIGGPLHGDRIETGGRETHMVMLPVPFDTLTYDWGGVLPQMTETIRRGEYRRERVSSYGTVRTVYVYQGER